MAASAWTIYSAAVLETMQGSVNWASSTIKCALLTSAYSPAVNTDTLWSGISANEASGTGYTAGGMTASALSLASSGGVATANGTIAAWTGASVAARFAVIYDSSSGKLLAYSDLTGGAGGMVSSTAGTFSVSGFSVTGNHVP